MATQLDLVLGQQPERAPRFGVVELPELDDVLDRGPPEFLRVRVQRPDEPLPRAAAIDKDADGDCVNAQPGGCFAEGLKAEVGGLPS